MKARFEYEALDKNGNNVVQYRRPLYEDWDTVYEYKNNKPGAIDAEMKMRQLALADAKTHCIPTNGIYPISEVRLYVD